MLACARRPLPGGTPLCILQRERVDTVGALGLVPFPAPPCLRWAPASTPLPAGVSPMAGRGHPEQHWAGGPASHLGSDPHSQPVLPVLPSLPDRCPEAPQGAPLARAGSCWWAGPRPWAGCQHPRVLAALLLGGPAAAPRPLGSPRGPCSSTSLSQGPQGLVNPHACPLQLPCPMLATSPRTGTGAGTRAGTGVHDHAAA